MSIEMKKLIVGGTEYEIVDAQARTKIDVLDQISMAEASAEYVRLTVPNEDGMGTYTLVTQAGMEYAAQIFNLALTQKANKTVATTTADGLMSAADKATLDAVAADYSAALTALGVS